METIKDKPIIWMGSSLEDIKDFPQEVKQEIGFVLGRVQQEEGHQNIKPLKGFSGVMEIRTSFMGDAYRTVYALKINENIFVLHVFQKKSKKGIETPKKELDMIKRRLKKAIELANEQVS